MSLSPMSRRGLLRGASAALLAVPLASLAGRRATAMARLEPIASPYGPIAPVLDQTTGLPLLQLPEGFTYQSFGWTGDLMDNGQHTPAWHDGMAVVQSRLVNGEAEFTLIRNHEATVDPRYGSIGATAVYDSATTLVGEDMNEEEVTGPAAGGTTNLVFRNGVWVAAAPSLGGTWVNCAGGATPWGTWLTCEEDKSDLTEQGGLPHGYVFEVTADPTATSAVPIKSMGRMDHEAVAFDPIGGALYLTEDDRHQSGLYKFVPNDASQRVGALEQGGTLYMAKVAGEDKADLRNPRMGDSFILEWVEIVEPDLAPQPFTEEPFDADNTASGPFVQGRDLGALRMARGEGIWYSANERLLYIVDTASGTDPDPASERFGEIGRGEGSVWTLDPITERLTCVFQSENPLAGDNFDNITVSPRGGVLLCEDGSGVEDAFGMGNRMMGLTPAGETYIFAKNNITLSPSDLGTAGKSAEFIPDGDYREMEFAGATFDPSGRWLFVNVQTPGVTFAITGPWEKGLL
jgi:secreted PhoX family phosphatase